MARSYCYFNKIIKGPGTSFQSPAMSQKYVRNIFHTTHQYFTKLAFDSTQDLKEIIIGATSIMLQWMASQILKFVHFIKTQKSRYLKNKTFFLQIKNHSLHIKSLLTPVYLQQYWYCASPENSYSQRIHVLDLYTMQEKQDNENQTCKIAAIWMAILFNHTSDVFPVIFNFNSK